MSGLRRHSGSKYRRRLRLEPLETRLVLVPGAPVTSGIADVTVDEGSADVTVDLFDSFEDYQDADSEMTYTVESNSNTALFDSTTYDGYGGLVLDFAANAYGTADLTVRATDTDGYSVAAQFTVTVNAVNDAPVISDFDGVWWGGDTWEFTGTVTDVDDDVEGLTVAFGGVLDSYDVTATVAYDGTFSLYDDFPGLANGSASAEATDDGGATSDKVWALVAV